MKTTLYFVNPFGLKTDSFEKDNSTSVNRLHFICILQKRHLR
jgi:hypothetical protein